MGKVTHRLLQKCTEIVISGHAVNCCAVGVLDSNGAICEVSDGWAIVGLYDMFILWERGEERNEPPYLSPHLCHSHRMYLYQSCQSMISMMDGGGKRRKHALKTEGPDPILRICRFRLEGPFSEHEVHLQ